MLLMRCFTEGIGIMSSIQLGDVLITPDSVELEEAYARTTSLPHGLEVQAGHYRTEFGHGNPQHAHAWSFTNQPVIATRALGVDGLSGVGARVGYRAPLPWRTQLIIGAQNTDDHGMDAINGIGGGHHHGDDDAEDASAVAGFPVAERTTTRSPGDLAWSARLEQRWQIDHLAVQLGCSAATTRNLTGSDTRTLLTGADVTLRWQRHDRPQWVSASAELIGRRVDADGFTAVGLGPDLQPDTGDETGVDVAATTLRDLGGWAQVEVGFAPGWSAGVRAEYVTAHGETVHQDEAEVTFDRTSDPLRDDRERYSALLAWRPSGFSRLRVQYDYDRADHLADGDAHTIALGADFLLGAHPTHGW